MKWEDAGEREKNRGDALGVRLHVAVDKKALRAQYGYAALRGGLQSRASADRGCPDYHAKRRVRHH
jgi:hypothetical protein